MSEILQLLINHFGLLGAARLNVHPRFSIYFYINAVPLQVTLVDLGKRNMRKLKWGRTLIFQVRGTNAHEIAVR